MTSGASMPNPGSREARDAGCRCPVIDNGRGLGYMGGLHDENGEPLFVVNLECPLHGTAFPATGEAVVTLG